MAFGRRVGFVVAGVIVLSLLGQAQVAGLLGLFGMLVAILSLALTGSRPDAKAHKASFLSRYRPADDSESLAGVTIAAMATWSVLELPGDANSAAVLGAGLWLPLIFYVLWPNLAAAVLGVLGALATALSLVLDRACVEAASARGLVVYGAVLSVSLLVFVLVRRGSFGFPHPLRRHYSVGTWALILFGLLDIAAFVVHPNGLEIWSASPWWATPTLLALVVVLASLAAYAPTLILGLTALGVVMGQVFLALADAEVVTPTSDPCGDPGLRVGFGVAFVVLAVAGLSLRPGRSSS